MNTIFPTIGQYNQHFQQNGSSGFQSLRNIVLIPSRTFPIKLFLFGSGAYAAVFKGTLHGKTYAIRCFLGSAQDTIPRYKLIGKSLRNFNSSWKVDFELLESELFIRDTLYPVLKMEWVEGQLINDFIDQNLYDNEVLTEIQRKLVFISNDLEKHGIAHGDLQFGNIMITGNSHSFELRLIDYDGMYVPGMSGWESIEIGRSEFQHPRRNKNNFNSEIDRFSFWVMLTGLEAIKHDKSLWKQVMQGGYNTLDNCLFTIQDFVNPNQSELFQKVSRLGNTQLDFYAGKLITFCLYDINSITAPTLYDEQQNSTSTSGNFREEATNPNTADFLTSSQNFKIDCVSGTATVLSSSFVKIGQTPILLEKKEFAGKTIIVSNGFETKQVVLFETQLEYNIQLNNRIDEKKKTSSDEIVDNFGKDPHTEEIWMQIEELGRKKAERKKVEQEKEEERQNKLEEEKEELENLKKRRENHDIRAKNEEEQKLKQHRRKRNWLIAILCLLFISGGSVYFYTKSSVKNSQHNAPVIYNAQPQKITIDPLPKKNITEAKKVINYNKIINEILTAEEHRDFDKIYSFYGPKMRRYWDIYNPTYLNLKKRYEHIWGFTSNSNNKVEKIEKVNSNTYNLYTEFSYYNINKGEEFIANSIIRFVFDDQGNISETYGIEQNIQKTENLTTTSSDNSKPPNDLFYIYKTTFDNAPFKISLRNRPSAGGDEIYSCPKNSIVYVIDKSGETYYKAYVNGYIGFLTKHYLSRKY